MTGLFTHKSRFDYKIAKQLADDLLSKLSANCFKISIAGSIRRQKPTVSDIELVIIPKFGVANFNELFPSERNLTFDFIDSMVKDNILSKRIKKDGTSSYGEKVRLLTHVESGIPVDLFFATEDNWTNVLFCRTGSKETNALIASTAIKLGYHWNMAGNGFISPTESIKVYTEEEIFKFVGLPYLPPELR